MATPRCPLARFLLIRPIPPSPLVEPDKEITSLSPHAGKALPCQAMFETVEDDEEL